MNLNNLCRKNAATHPEAAVQECLRSLVIRTNLVPGVRHVLGWRGVKGSAHGVESWTVRVAGRSGVFGLVFDTVSEVGPWRRGLFNVCYFPGPDEELVEQVCVQAALLTAQPDYLEQVRDFTVHESLIDLFNVGVIELGLNIETGAVSLAVESMDRQQVVAVDGVQLEQAGESVELVPPGGFDQDFPAWAVCWDLFRVLAASLSFNLEAPPEGLLRTERLGWVRSYNGKGEPSEHPAPGNPRRLLRLVYGAEAGAPDQGWTEVTAPDDDLADEAWWSAHRIGDFKAVDKHALGIDERPQLIVLTGFLGAGKTTFLQNFIDHQNRNNRFVAVIQNEIGEVGLDGSLLDHDYAVTEIDEGCICCTLVGNVKTALHQIMGEFHPDYIMLETTGLANPLNLLDELAEVADLVRFDSVTTLVDGVNLEQALAESHVARDQIRAADIVLLNKADLLSEAEVAAVQERIAGINANAPVIPTTHGDINPALLYGDEPGTPTAAGEGHGHDHRHDHVSTSKLVFPEPVDLERFTEALDAVPRDVFRIKGVVRIAGRDEPQVVQFVAGRHEISEFPGHVQSDEGYLVCIGKDLDADALARLFGLESQRDSDAN